MRSRRRHVAAIAAMVVAVLPAAPSRAQVDPHVYASAAALKGDWRPIGDSQRDPTLVQVACDPSASLEDCARQQGTYQADVFLRVGSSAGGQLRMISDGALDATIATVAAKPTGPHDTTSARTFAVTLAEGGTARLVFGGLNGHCAAPESLGRLCFDILGAPAGAALADGTYEEAVPRTQPARTQTLGDAFAGLPPNFLSMLTCADITQMDPDDLRYRGCTSPIFLSPNKDPFAGSKRYDFAYFADHNYVVPFGWEFADRSGGVGGESSKVIESGQDLTESASSSLGVNASVNLFFVTASVKHNTKTESRVENMYDNSLTYSQFSYLQTQFALVLDKQNAALDPYFVADALNLTSSPKPDYSWFIGRWGTHYVHAATFGETGKLFSTYTKSDVEQLHENGVDVSTAVEAGVSYMGMGASAGVDVDNAKSQLAKMHQTLGNDFGAFQCSGGVTCDGKSASAGNTPPILLDLRPISDLFGPPFFPNVAVDRLLAVRKGLGTAIVGYAFKPAGGTDGKSAEFGRITGLTVQPQVAGTLVPPTITLTIGDVSRTFSVDLSHQDGKSPIPLQAAGESLGFGWAPGGSVAVDASAPVASCHLEVPPTEVGGAAQTSPIDPNGPPPFHGWGETTLPQTADVGTKGSGQVAFGFGCPLLSKTPLPGGDVGMDIAGYCRSLGYQNADNASGDAYGWRCQPGDVGLDLQDLCQKQAGPDMEPVIADPSTNRWACRAPAEMTGVLSWNFEIVPASALLQDDSLSQR